MAHYRTSVTAFDAAVLAAESARQTAVSGATQVVARSAELTYFRTCYNAAIANNISPSVFSEALKSLGVQT